MLHNSALDVQQAIYVITTASVFASKLGTSHLSA